MVANMRRIEPGPERVDDRYFATIVGWAAVVRRRISATLRSTASM
jgi:hypothetical protein